MTGGNTHSAGLLRLLLYLRLVLLLLLPLASRPECRLREERCRLVA